MLDVAVEQGAVAAVEGVVGLAAGKAEWVAVYLHLRVMS